MQITLNIEATSSYNDNPFDIVRTAENLQQVRLLMKMVGIEEKPGPGYVDPTAAFELRQFLQGLTGSRPNKIRAIKYIRRVTGMGLTDSKRFYEDNFQHFVPPAEQQSPMTVEEFERISAASREWASRNP